MKKLNITVPEIVDKEEIRFLVDAYYIIQKDRKRYTNQVRAVRQKRDAPNAATPVLDWFAETSRRLERQIETSLKKYLEKHVMYDWLMSIHGIGPILGAGLVAMIDIEKASCVSSIWRYAGLDPTVKWEKGQKCPWNINLKALCWLIGRSFMFHSGNPKCFYGQIYRSRKEYEIQRNESGGNTELAKQLLEKYSPTTQAYKQLSQGKLPSAQLEARARRYAVKMFLSHFHTVWYRRHFGKEPPKPYAIAFLNHVHYIEPPSNK